MQIDTTYPGGSRSRVNRAGNNVRSKVATEEDYAVIEEWRAAHRPVLNTFQAILRNRTRFNNVVVAQRHKRRRTIFNKLSRHPKMQLSRMDDVAGCRLIFDTIDQLRAFRKSLHKARFDHDLKNDKDKYDYIKTPKRNGYRGVHDVYSYNVRSERGQASKGLLIELQYRTKIQHAWATAVEVIGFVTQSQPKFEQGDNRYLYTMSLASELLARAFEDTNGPHPQLSSEELAEKFLAAEADIGLLNMLKGLNATETAHSENRNSILIFTDSGDLDIRSFRDAPEALRELFRLEQELPTADIVLVRADNTAEVRIAFKNYFSDAKEFVDLIEDACMQLGANKVDQIRKRKRERRQPQRLE